jgi:hypothetical protein
MRNLPCPIKNIYPAEMEIKEIEAPKPPVPVTSSRLPTEQLEAPAPQPGIRRGRIQKQGLSAQTSFNQSSVSMMNDPFTSMGTNLPVHSRVSGTDDPFSNLSSDPAAANSLLDNDPFAITTEAPDIRLSDDPFAAISYNTQSNILNDPFIVDHITDKMAPLSIQPSRQPSSVAIAGNFWEMTATQGANTQESNHSLSTPSESGPSTSSWSRHSNSSTNASARFDMVKTNAPNELGQSLQSVQSTASSGQSNMDGYRGHNRAQSDSVGYANMFNLMPASGPSSRKVSSSAAFSPELFLGKSTESTTSPSPTLSHRKDSSYRQHSRDSSIDSKSPGMQTGWQQQAIQQGWTVTQDQSATNISDDAFQGLVPGMGQPRQGSQSISLDAMRRMKQ